MDATEDLAAARIRERPVRRAPWTSRYHRPAHDVFVAGLLVALLLTLGTGCAVNPVTGERELSLLSTADEISIGEGQYGSYCQIWCTEGWSCGGPAVLYDLDTVRELDPLDHFAELPEAA